MITRYFSSASLGLLVAAALLRLMQSLIEVGPPVVVDEPPVIPVGWLAEPAPEVIVRDDAPPLVPRPLQPPDRRPPIGEGGISVDPPTGPPPVEPESGWERVPIRMTDGPLVAVMNVQPAYPAQAAVRGLEGHAVVQFDVGPTGSVSNVVVLEASHRVFERPAIEAALRSRYRPRVVDGVPVTTTAVRMLYRFELEK